jgi:oxygen-dependent protoporphyrinogen oxidase
LPQGTVELGARVTQLVHGDEGWNVNWIRDGESHTETVDKVILALPAHALARLTIGSLAERPLAELAEIIYPPVASVFLGFRREDVAHPLDGFGVLMPQKEHRQVLGILFSSSLFVRRAPDGHVALTVMMGGVRRPDLGEAADETLLKTAQRELGELLGVKGDPVFQRINRWAKAIPQYNLGYGRFLDAMERCEREHTGLLVGGHVRDGISLPNCLTAGQKLAERATT